jgi:hypothetical protein
MQSEPVRDVARVNFLEDTKSEVVWAISRSAAAVIAIVLDSSHKEIGHANTARAAIDMAMAKLEPFKDTEPDTMRAEAGQVWIDNDKRVTDGRAVLIKSIQTDSGRPTAVTVVGNVVGGVFSPKHPVRISKILVSRLKPTASGYRLMEEPASVGA